MAISTNGTIITRLAGALYNEYLSNAYLTGYVGSRDGVIVGFDLLRQTDGEVLSF